jgi:cytochrome P450
VTVKSELYYDPYDLEIHEDPYPTFKRLREEVPLYYNDRHDFYAVSRYADVARGFIDKENLISSKGDVLELIKANVQMPLGTFIYEDPPLHTVHRGVVAGVFTPKRMASIEPLVRAYAARCLDEFVGAGRFDFIANLGAEMPMRVIGMLLGIPESEQEQIHVFVEDSHRVVEPGGTMEFNDNTFAAAGEIYRHYIEWRADNPSDDLMTDLLNVEFIDEQGVQRRLTHGEILMYVSLISGAGNETTQRLIGWAGKVLADHPEQRRELVDDHSLIPQAVHELLRFEPPSHQVARVAARDVEFQGQTVPAGAILLCVTASANRDEQVFPDGETFNIHRKPNQIMSFGHGVHFCLGAALARLEGQVAVEEVLKRFPVWEVDIDNAKLAPTTSTRGWETLPTFI